MKVEDNILTKIFKFSTNILTTKNSSDGMKTVSGACHSASVSAQIPDCSTPLGCAMNGPTLNRKLLII